MFKRSYSALADYFNFSSIDTIRKCYYYCHL